MKLLVLAVLLGACTKKPAKNIDLDLPEQSTAVDRQEPLALLEAMASEQDVSLRGRALGFLVGVDPTVWGDRALYDPDGWVQRQGALALLEHKQPAPLVAYVERGSGDPYVRGLVARSLADVPIAAVYEAEQDPWRATPLAYAALTHGHEAALERVVRAVSHGELALEEDFVRALGACRTYEQVPTGACERLLDAFREGEAWVEEELRLSYGAARLLLGDGSGEQLLRKGLGGDLKTQVATLDQLAQLQTAEAVALLRKARGSGLPLSQAYASLILASREPVSIEPFQVAAAHKDAELRALGARFAGRRLAARISKGAKGLEQLIQNAAVDPASNVRQAALEAAIDARLGPAIFKRALTDESAAVRLLAAGGLLQQRS